MNIGLLRMCGNLSGSRRAVVETVPVALPLSHLSVRTDSAVTI
jgi:hypothetical protein